jgi:predicted DCC family thiol-disulfide oxidoreductase YuxK
MKFAPLQGEYARALLVRHPRIRGLDSLVLVDQRSEPETVTAQWRAVREVLLYLGGGWGIVGAMMRIVPVPIGDFMYAAFARMRYRVFGRYDVCRLPTPEQRVRFID